jgi:hypothetical protein
LVVGHAAMSLVAGPSNNDKLTRRSHEAAI